MTILVNKNNIAMDLLNEVRYTKLQSQPRMVISCERKDEASGVIASDCDTILPLLETDMTNSTSAVRPIEVESMPSNIFVPERFKYNPETQEVEYVETLDEFKHSEQNANKAALSSFLATQYIVWEDGKKYGVTETDQAEISLYINQYNIAAQTRSAQVLEWHALQETSVPWSLEDLSRLSVQISEFVRPYYALMQQYKGQIYAAASYAELEGLVYQYGDPEEEKEEESEEILPEADKG